MGTKRFEIEVSRSAVLAAFARRNNVRDMGLYVLEQSESKRLGRMLFEDATDWGVAIALQSFFREAKALWGKVPSKFKVVIEKEPKSASVVSIEVACKGGSSVTFA